MKIPQSVVNIVLKRLELALVEQFLGPIPPFWVFVSMVNRLWGYEGSVQVSTISDGVFLIEPKSMELSNWILSRSWHIHHSALLIRRWKKGIEPVVVAPEDKPVWLTLKKVPPQLISNEGIGWIASQIGKPASKFVREGLYVKVCVLMGQRSASSEALQFHMGEEGLINIEVVYPVVRTYGRQKGVVYRRVTSAHPTPEDKASSPPSNVPEPPLGGEETPGEADPKPAEGEPGSAKDKEVFSSSA
ncbi:hypothetical protein LINPERPRIM_LOCUS37528 [Linum perenne]